MAALDPFEVRNITEMQQLIQYIRNDIAGNAQRAKTIQEFLERCGIYINFNPLWTTKYNDATMHIVNNIAEPMQRILTGLPVGGSRVLFQEVAKQYTMDKVTKLGDDMKNQLRQITSDGLAEGKSHMQIAKDMDDKVATLGRTRAEVIAQTETHRAKNLGNWYKYKEAGYKYFTVSYASNACPKCVAAFRGRVFRIDEIAFLPPFHPRCRCAAKFHREMPKGYELHKQQITEFKGDGIYTHAKQNLISQYTGVWKDGVGLTGNIKTSDLSDIGLRLLAYKNTKWDTKVNSILRGQLLPDLDVQKLLSEIKLFDRIFKGTGIDRDIKVYRAVTNIFQGNKAGDIVPIKGYLSTTTNIDHVYERIEGLKDGYVMKILVPKGTKGVQVETALRGTAIPNEWEWLMPHGTYLRFTKIDHKNRVVEAVVVNDKVY